MGSIPYMGELLHWGHCPDYHVPTLAAFHCMVSIAYMGDLLALRALSPPKCTYIPCVVLHHCHVPTVTNISLLAGRPSEVWCWVTGVVTVHTWWAGRFRTQVIRFISAGCWSTPMSTDHAQINTNSLLMSLNFLNKLSKQHRAKLG